MHWTTEDIRAALGFEHRASARKWIQRQRAQGAAFEVTIDPVAGEKTYSGTELRKLLDEAIKRKFR